eukprot:TRINITY_DN60173_c0_g1_i1.p1 TRINITY_DN60173_c0_g1~~TRINITY_DN60173_c0_g1_i1.p1  ORF type:complete len:458 (+),score=115.11 TRINITY_DN60173_c0_g1_i1:98-1375(+)
MPYRPSAAFAAVLLLVHPPCAAGGTGALLRSAARGAQLRQYAASGGAPASTAEGAAPSATSPSLGVSTCPLSAASSDFAFPSTAALSALAALEAVVFAVFTACRYNYLSDLPPHSRAFLSASEGLSWHGGASGSGGAGRRPRKDEVGLTSNTYWVVYFAQVALKHGVDALLYGDRSIATSEHAAAYLHYASLVLHALTCVSLTLALLFQHKYRGDAEGLDGSASDGTESTHQPALRAVCRRLASAEVGLIVLALLHAAAAWFATKNLPGAESFDRAYDLFAVACALQRLPLLAVVVLIVVPPHAWRAACGGGRGELLLPQPDASSCPSPCARVVLALAILTDLPHMVPAAAWTQHVLPHSLVADHPCPLWLLSWYDCALVLYLAALALFFVFLRLEYFRVGEYQRYLWLESETNQWRQGEAARPH